MPLLGPGPQYDIKYTLTGPDGTRAVFNDKTDADYVGALTSISGFDSPEVRESADELVQFDGGVHGDFWYGRRPMTMEGIIYDHGSATVRNTRVARLAAATNAMREDATLEFQPSGSPAMFIKVRRQQPIRVDGAWNKTFQIPLVAADPRFYSSTLSTTVIGSDAAVTGTGFAFPISFPLGFGTPIPKGQVLINNEGNGESFPVYSIFGPGNGPYIYNATTGKFITLNYPLSTVSDGFVIDSMNRRVYLGSRDTSYDLVNMVPNPGFENGSVSDWVAYQNGGTGTLTASPTFARSGSYGGKLTATSAITELGAAVGLTSSAWIPVAPGDQVSCAGYSRAGSTTRQFRMAINWYTSASAFISTSFGSYVTNTAAGWTRAIPLTATAPATAAYARVYLIHAGGLANGEIHYVDDVIASIGSAVPAYFDGNSPGCGWDGIANASTSRAYSTTLKPDTITDKYSAVDFVNTDWGGLVAGVNDLRIGFYDDSHGARLRVDWRSSWL